MWNRANPLANPDKGKDSKDAATKIASPNIQASQKNPLAIDPFGLGSNPSSVSPFHAKVQESHAKLAAKATPPNHDQGRAQLINPATAKPAAPRKETQPKNRADHDDRAPKTDDAGRAQANKAAQGKGRKDKTAQSGHAKADSKPDADANDRANDGGDRNVKNTQDGTQSAKKTNDDSADANDGKAKEALQARLEKMGVTATDEQLNDPAFLRDMLKLVQATAPAAGDADTAAADTGAQDLMPAAPVSQTKAAPEAAGSAEAIASIAVPVTTDASAQTATVAVADDAKNPLATQAPDQKDLASLIKDRINELTKSPETAGSAQSQAAAGNFRPGVAADPGAPGWRGMRISRDEQGITTDPMPTADLDRMRVMQAAAMQAANAGSSKDHVDLSAADSLDTTDHAPELGSVQAAVSDKAGNAQDQSADADSFGQNQNQSQGTEGTAGTQSPQIARDVPAGPQFHQTLDQIRAAEHKPATESVWAPHQTNFDKGIIDQITKKMTGVSHLNGEEISIQLEPENLGKIRVGLGLKDGVMTAHIGVESEQVKQIVEANLSNLRDTLENQGLKLQGLEVTVDQRHSSLFNPDGRNSQTFFNQHGRGGNLAADGSEIPALDSSPESETGRRLGYNTMEYIA